MENKTGYYLFKSVRKQVRWSTDAELRVIMNSIFDSQGKMVEMKRLRAAGDDGDLHVHRLSTLWGLIVHARDDAEEIIKAAAKESMDLRNKTGESFVTIGLGIPALRIAGPVIVSYDAGCGPFCAVTHALMEIGDLVVPGDLHCRAAYDKLIEKRRYLVDVLAQKKEGKSRTGYYVFRNDKRQISWKSDTELSDKYMTPGRHQRVPCESVSGLYVYRLDTADAEVVGRLTPKDMSNETGYRFVTEGLGSRMLSSHWPGQKIGPILVTNSEARPPMAQEELDDLERIAKGTGDRSDVRSLRKNLSNAETQRDKRVSDEPADIDQPPSKKARVVC